MKRLITRQSDLNDCGPAVIYSLVKYYKGYVSLERIKLDTHLDKTGISAYDMVLALNSYGFDARGLKMRLEDLKSTKIPLILHCLYGTYGHFVLLIKASKNRVTIMNPAKGIEKLSWKELEKIWSGIVIKAVPISKIVHLEKEKSLKDLFLATFKAYSRKIISIITLGLLVNLLSIMLNYYLKIASSLNSLIRVMIVFMVLTSLKAIGNVILQRIVITTDWSLEYNFTMNIINHLFGLPLSNLELVSKGRILKYINDLNTFKEAFLEFILEFFLGVIEIMFLLGLLMSINRFLGFLLIIILGIYFILKIVSVNLNKKRLESTINNSNTYQEELLETVSKVKMMKRLHKKNYFQERFARSFLDYLDTNRTYLHFLSKYRVIEEFFLDVLNILGISVSLVLVNKNLIELVDLFTYLTLSTYLLKTFKNILETLPKYSYLKENYLHLSEFLALRKENTREGIPFTNGDIIFKNVSFSYNTYDEVIKNLNQVIKVSEKVILTGESGCGKSSLVKILYRFYEVSKGNVLIKGINILDYDLNSLRSSISYVSQDESLFKGTLYENITLGEEVKSDDLARVIRICKLENVIDKAVNHLETVILDEETNFSGGEIMRIILARTLLRKSDILILDEALSGVDEDMEREIVKGIIKEYPTMTLIYITHRDLKSLFDREIRLDN